MKQPLQRLEESGDSESLSRQKSKGLYSTQNTYDLHAQLKTINEEATHLKITGASEDLSNVQERQLVNRDSRANPRIKSNSARKHY